MKFIIIANAKPITPKELEKLPLDSKIIALDGIANNLLDLNFSPFAIVGDFDSIQNKTIEAYKKLGVPLYKVDDQNSTDLEKGIELCKSFNATDIIIINAIGGKRVDHTLMNYRILKRHHSDNIRVRIKEEESFLEFFRDTEVIISGKEGDDIALLAAFKARVTSSGLKYEMNNYHLKFGLQESTSNSMKYDKATIKIKGDVILIYNVKCNTKTHI